MTSMTSGVFGLLGRRAPAKPRKLADVAHLVYLAELGASENPESVRTMAYVLTLAAGQDPWLRHALTVCRTLCGFVEGADALDRLLVVAFELERFEELRTSPEPPEVVLDPGMSVDALSEVAQHLALEDTDAKLARIVDRLEVLAEFYPLTDAELAGVGVSHRGLRRSPFGLAELHATVQRRMLARAAAGTAEQDAATLDALGRWAQESWE